MEKRECWDKKGECGGGFKGSGQGKPPEKRGLKEVRKLLHSPKFTYQVCSIWLLRASIISLANTTEPYFSV